MGVIGGKWLAVQYRFERSVKVLSLEKVTVSKKMSSVFLKNYFNESISNLTVAQIRIRDTSVTYTHETTQTLHNSDLLDVQISLQDYHTNTL